MYKRQLLCSALIALLYGLLLKLMGPATDLAGLSPALTAMMLVLANLTFLLLDVALGRLTALSLIHISLFPCRRRASLPPCGP